LHDDPARHPVHGKPGSFPIAYGDVGPVSGFRDLKQVQIVVADFDDIVGRKLKVISSLL